jgi:hypothetical protein
MNMTRASEQLYLMWGLVAVIQALTFSTASGAEQLAARFQAYMDLLAANVMELYFDVKKGQFW